MKVSETNSSRSFSKKVCGKGQGPLLDTMSKSKLALFTTDELLNSAKCNVSFFVKVVYSSQTRDGDKQKTPSRMKVS